MTSLANALRMPSRVVYTESSENFAGNFFVSM